MIGAATIIVAALVAFLLTSPTAPKDTANNYSRQLEEIWSAGQTYDGEVEDKMVELGPDAIPAIAQAALDAERFHIHYIRALARIGDQKAIDPLLRLLEHQRPAEFGTDKVMVLSVVHALKQLNAMEAVDSLFEIAEGDNVHPQVRLVSAGYVAALGSGNQQRIAASMILEMSRERENFYRRRSNGFYEIDMVHALIDVDTDESRDVLLDIFSQSDWIRPYVALPIVNYFGEVSTPRTQQALIDAIEDAERFEYPIRVQALETLGKDETLSKTPQFDNYLAEIAAEAERDRWTGEYAERLKSLLDARK